MSEAKAKALARRQRILAQSEARMAVAKGELVVGVESSDVAEAPGVVESNSDSVEGTQHAQVVEPQVNAKRPGRVLASRREKIAVKTTSAGSAADVHDSILEEAFSACLDNTSMEHFHSDEVKSSCDANQLLKSTSLSSSAIESAPDDSITVPSITEHSRSTRQLDSKSRLNASTIRSRGFIRVDKASIVRILHILLILCISCMNGLRADLRILRPFELVSMDPNRQLREFIKHAEGLAEQSPSHLANDEFEGAHHAYKWEEGAQTDNVFKKAFEFVQRWSVALMENSISCVIIVHWILVPRVLPLFQQLLMLVRVVDNDFLNGRKSSGTGMGLGLVTQVLNIVMGGVSGLIGFWVDMLTYVGMHFLFTIWFSVLFHMDVSSKYEDKLLGDAGRDL